MDLKPDEQSLVGISLAELSSRRLTALRQFEKYEHTRMDADAAVEAGRWRLAVLSARAAVGFALDVLRAASVGPRDEVRRRQVVADVISDPGLAATALELLEEPVAEPGAAAFVRRCWSLLDAVGPDGFGVPPYYEGDPTAHEADRATWLVLARRVGLGDTPFSPGAIDQLLGQDPSGRP